MTGVAWLVLGIEFLLVVGAISHVFKVENKRPTAEVCPKTDEEVTIAF